MAGDDDTTAIADEAAATRERISTTIDALQDRLNPRRIVGDAVESVQAGGAELVRHGVDLARAHPAVLAAVGLAIGLTVLGGSRLKHARVDLGDGHESYSDYDDDYGAAAEEPERFALLRSGAASTGSTIADNPVVAVLVGLAAGALVGALFPETERERRLLGASADRLTAAARAAARTARDELATAADKVVEVTDHARHAVQSVVDAARGELAGG